MWATAVNGARDGEQGAVGPTPSSLARPQLGAGPHGRQPVHDPAPVPRRPAERRFAGLGGHRTPDRQRVEDDRAIVARLSRGDEDAYRQLIRRHQGPLLALARTIVRDRGTAEEVVQDTWLAVVTNIARFEGRSALSTWITEILLNKARTRARRDGRVRNFSDLVPAGMDDDGASAERFLADGHWAGPVTVWDRIDPERIVAGRELWAEVARAIELLPEAQRAVVILRDVEGHDAGEIGRLLDLSEVNVRVLLHRARQRLRDLVDRLVSDEPPREAVNTRHAPRP